MADKEKPQKAAKAGGPPAGKPGKEAKAKAPKAAAAPREWKPRPADYKPRLKTHYEKVVRDALKEKFAYANPMQIPKIEKIVQEALEFARQSPEPDPSTVRRHVYQNPINPPEALRPQPVGEQRGQPVPGQLETQR